jgi:alpha-beta hydrolase superfamily lysophospholipase
MNEMQKPKRKKRSKWMLIICIIIAVLIILLISLGFFLANYSMNGKNQQTLEEARTWQEEHYDISWYDPMEKTDYTVTSYDGYVLHAQFLKNPGDTERYILISHGYTDNRFGSLKYARMYLELGFNVILYDLRGHGLNEPAFCTYTVRERKDLLAMILDSRERYPDASLFGLHGESLGAATSIAVVEEKPPVDFVVSDCGFSDIVPVLKIGLKGMHLPGFLVNIASVCAKIRFGYSFSEMRPIGSLKENTIPILFIHGAEDRFILPEHSERMKEATKGYAELHLIPGADHAMSGLTDPKAYRKYVADFLAEQFPGR